MLGRAALVRAFEAFFFCRKVSKHARWRPPFYVAVVYHGDSGGLLDATLRRLTELLEKQWQLTSTQPDGEPPLFHFMPAPAVQSGGWEGLTAYQQHISLVLLLRGLATAVACGVPIVQAMRLTYAVLPESAAAGWLEAIQTILKGEPIVPSLASMNTFPGFVLQLISIGEELGTLDSTLMNAADILECEQVFARKRRL